MTKRKPLADPGEGPEKAHPSHYFLNQTEAWRANKNFFGNRASHLSIPPPLSAPRPATLSQGMDPALETNSNKQAGSEITQYNIDSISPSF